MPNTPYYNQNIPTVGADADTWGTENNDAHIKWDDVLASPTNTIKGRTTAGTGPHQNLTPAQIAAMLPALVGDAGSGGTKGLVPAPATGDAAAGKVLGAGGGWVAPPPNPVKAWGLFTGSTGATVAASNLSCVRNSESVFTFTFGTPLANANYALTIQPADSGYAFYHPLVNSKSASGFSIQTIANLGGTTGGADPAQLNVTVVGA